MKILVIGHGGIGSEVAKQLLEKGHEVAVITSKSKSEISEGLKRYNNVKEPLLAFLDFKPNTVIDASAPEFTQKVLEELALAENEYTIYDNRYKIGDFVYFAITPDKDINGNSTNEIIEKFDKEFKEKNITVERTDKTNTVFADMVGELSEALKENIFKKIKIYDEHRKEKEAFTQGTINIIKNMVNWEDVESATIKIDNEQCEKRSVKTVDDFEKLVGELRSKEGDFEKLNLKLNLIGSRFIKFKTIREIPDEIFESSKEGARSINYLKIIKPDSSKNRKCKAIINREIIAEGTIKKAGELYLEYAEKYWAKFVSKKKSAGCESKTNQLNN